MRTARTSSPPELPLLERLYPPRATVTAPPAQLARLKGYVGQYKYNDIRVLIHLLPGGGIELLTRKREPVREYRPTRRLREALRSLDLDPARHHVLDGGVLRHLQAGGERPVIIWDILVWNDRHLVGTSYLHRYDLLKGICGSPETTERVTPFGIGLSVRGPLWLAPLFRTGLRDRFENALQVDYLEGLMLKDPRGRLEPGFRQENNTRWQVKVRKPRVDYFF